MVGIGKYGDQFSLRDFQREILEISREKNIVMVGQTGIGKTHVAIAMLIEQDYSNNKRAFFMAPTRQLVMQITAKIRQTSTLRANAYCGRAVDLWDGQQWEREFNLTRVFVCTPEIVRNILEKGYITMDRINLLVFDECHHVTKRHPYAQVIKMYHPPTDDDPTKEVPRIFGTTACPTKRCAENLYADMHKIELPDMQHMKYAACAPLLYETYKADSEQEEPEGNAEKSNIGSFDLSGITQSSKAIYANILKDFDDGKVIQVINKLLKKGNSINSTDEERLEKRVRKFEKDCVTIYMKLGQWCFYRFIELEVQRLAMAASPLVMHPGSMMWMDKDAVKTIMIMECKRNQCNFSCNPKVAMIEKIVLDRLLRAEANNETLPTSSDAESTASSESETQETDAEDSASGVEDEGGEESRPNLKGIVFVNTRNECRVLTEYLNEKLSDLQDSELESTSNEPDFAEDNDSNYEEEKDPLFACMLGQAGRSDTASFGLNKMQSILEKFENGGTKILVSTSVSVEGVDFPLCSLVVVADRMTTPRMLIQLRGRARHEDGLVYYLGQEGDLDHHVHFQKLNKEADEINRLDFSSDKKESILHQPRSVACNALQGLNFYPNESLLIIESTGARLDLDSSISCLNQYCQSLPAALFTVDMKNLFVFTQSTVMRRPVFTATLHLPEGIGIGPFQSEPMQSKAMAKAAAAFEGCRELLNIGQLDEYLNSIYRKGKSKVAVENHNLEYFLSRLHL